MRNVFRVAILVGLSACDGNLSLKNPNPSTTLPPLQAPERDYRAGMLAYGSRYALDYCGAQSATMPLSNQVGPIDLQYGVNIAETSRSAVHFYIVSDGKTVAELLTRRPFPGSEQRLLIRVTDPDDRLVYWGYQQSATANSPAQKFSDPVVPPADGRICLGTTGTYRVQIYGNHNVDVALALSPNAQYGVSFPYLNYRAWPGQPTEMFFWAPVHRAIPLKLTLSGGEGLSGISVTDMTRNSDITTLPELVIPPDPALEGHEMRMRFARPGWVFRATGFPLILSNTREAAKAIRGSLYRINQGLYRGALVSHRFQVEIAENIIPHLLNEIGDAAQLFRASGANYPATQAACMNPNGLNAARRAYFLIGDWYAPFAAAKWSLGADQSAIPWQNVNPSSRWLGAVGLSKLGAQLCERSDDCVNGTACVGGKCEREFNESVDYWDTLRPLRYEGSSVYPTGLSPTTGVWAAVGFSATHFHPCNFYGPKSAGAPAEYPALLARAALSNLVDFLSFQAEGHWAGLYNSSEYSGGAAFAVGPKISPAFAYVAPHLTTYFKKSRGKNRWGDERETVGEAAHRTWAEGIRLLQDRIYLNPLVTARNQSAHLLLAFRHHFEGSRGLVWADLMSGLSRNWASWFVDNAHPSGYYAESLGPSPSYNGITHWHMAAYLKSTEVDPQGPDQKMRVALERSYDYFNHSVVREPSGQANDGYSFGHRIGNGITLEQWSGARDIVMDSPAVSLWSPTVSLTQALNALRNLARGFDAYAESLYAGGEYRGNVSYGGVHYDGENRVTGLLPSERAGSFDHLVADEFLAVKRSTYYAQVYFGKPAPVPFYVSKRDSLRDPIALENLPPGASAQTNIDIYHSAPFNGGGLTIVGSAFGASIQATNWSPLTHHGLVLERNEGGRTKRYWEEYFSVDYDFDSTASILEVRGTLEKVPLQFTRRYQFRANEIGVSVLLRAQSAFSATDLAEVLPLASCSRPDCAQEPLINRKREGTLFSFLGEVPGSVPMYPVVANGMRVSDSRNRFVEVRFTGNQNLAFANHGLRFEYYGDETQVSWLKVKLPNSFSTNQTYQLDYRLVLP